MDQSQAVDVYFARQPEAQPLFLAACDRILARFPSAKIKAQKSQFAIAEKRSFCYLWLPPHQVKGRPDLYLVLSFSLDRQIEHPRIVEAVQPYPRRWMHHLLVASAADIDGQVLGWLDSARQFANRP